MNVKHNAQSSKSCAGSISLSVEADDPAVGPNLAPLIPRWSAAVGPFLPRQLVGEAVFDEILRKSSPVIEDWMVPDIQARRWIRPQPSYEPVALEAMLKVVKRVIGKLKHRHATICQSESRSPRPAASSQPIGSTGVAQKDFVESWVRQPWHIGVGNREPQRRIGRNATNFDRIENPTRVGLPRTVRSPLWARWERIVVRVGMGH